MSPLLGVYLFTTIILILGLRPRKPYIIHSYINKMFYKVFIMVDLLIGGLMLLIWIALQTNATENLLGLWIIALLFIGAISLYVVFSSGQAFAKKKMGVEAVDKAIELHKKPNERAIGIMGGWCPDLVVDGKPYKTVVYALKSKNQVVGTLAFDLQGEVIRSAMLVDKIHCCYSFAQEFVNPECINKRTRNYMGAVKARKSWESMLQNYKKMLKQLQEASKNELYEHALKLQRTFELYHRYNETLMDVWMNEAKWGKEHGNTNLKVVNFADVEEMEKYWKEKMFWWLDEYKEFLSGLDSAKVLLKAMDKEPILLIPGIRVYITQILKFKDMQGIFEAWEKNGEVRYKYTGLTPEAQDAWVNQMKWVKQVDYWRENGASEEEIIELNRKAEKIAKDKKREKKG